MTPELYHSKKNTNELERLEVWIMSKRHKGRHGKIVSAWKAYLKTLERKEPWWKKWLKQYPER